MIEHDNGVGDGCDESHVVLHDHDRDVVLATDPARSEAYYHRAYQTIIDDAPAIWLYEVPGMGAINKRIHPAGVRADGWWADLAAWSIPDDQRIARDRIGLADAQP